MIHRADQLDQPNLITRVLPPVAMYLLRGGAMVMITGSLNLNSWYHDSPSSDVSPQGWRNGDDNGKPEPKLVVP